MDRVIDSTERKDILLTLKNTRLMSDLTPADEAILRVLHEGRATQGYIVSKADVSRTHVYNRLQLMEARGWIRNIHEQTSLWEITDEAPTFDDVGEDRSDG